MEMVRHWPTVRFNNGKAGKNTVLFSLEIEKERANVCVCVCLCVYEHIWRWKKKSTGKEFTGDSTITEMKIRNSYLWCQKKKED